MNHSLVRTTVYLAALALAASAVGLVFGANPGWTILAAGLAAILAYHIINLRRLLRWLGSTDSGEAPTATGIWDDAFALLYRREREHKRATVHLEEQLLRYLRAGRALPDAVISLDADNRIQWCNDKAQSDFGIDGQADLGQSITNLVRQPEFVEYIGSGDFTKPMELRTSRGAGLVLAVQIIRYDYAQKLLLARDVTQAETLDRVRRDFVANVSHELRTPLTVLAGFLETIRELKLDPQRARDYLGMMADQSHRMQTILDDLLTLSSLESAPESPRDERVVISRLLARIRAEAELLSAGKHRVSLDAQGDYDLLGSESELASAFGNLVTNAIRYTREGGEVRLVWRASPDGVAFTVEDTGIGIEPEYIPRLTERFYRVDRGRSRETGGTGLGLAIVKHALLRHQASLDVDSEPGRGSRFTARFPAQRVVVAQASSGVAA